MIRLRFSNAEVREVTELLGAGPEPPRHLSAPPDLRRWLHQVGPHHLPPWPASGWPGAPGPGAVGKRPRAGPGLVSRLRRELREGAPLALEDLALDGRTLSPWG